MLVEITVKDPDGVYEAIRDAAYKSISDDQEWLDEEERVYAIERRREAINDALSKWIKYGEYIRIEFDSEAMTAKVLDA